MTFKIFLHKHNTILDFSKIEERVLMIPYFYERGPKKVRKALEEHEDFPSGYSLVTWRII